MLIFNKFKKHIAILITLVLFLNFGLNVKKSDAAIPLLVYGGLAAVLVAAGVCVETGNTDDLVYAVEGFWDWMKDDEQRLYSALAQRAYNEGNFPLSDELWARANQYVSETYDVGVNHINVNAVGPNVSDDLIQVYNDGSYISRSRSNYYSWGNGMTMGSYSIKFFSSNGINLHNVSGQCAWDYQPYVDYIGNGQFILNKALWHVNTFTIYWSESSPFTVPSWPVSATNVISEDKDYELTVYPISPEEFNHSTPVPDGMTPERRIAVPPSVFSATTPEEAVSVFTGKTAADIWGAVGAYPDNSTTFDPVDPTNPIVPWVPIADPSTFTPAGDQAAQITATAPTNLQGSNTDLNSISGSIGSIWDLLKTGFEALIDTIWTGISHLLEGLQSISLSLTNIFGLINTGVSAIVGAISSIWDLVYEGFASIAQALRNLLDKTAEIANTLNPASDTFFLRVACVPDAAVLQGFADSINNNLNNKFQFLDIYQEIQDQSNSDSNNQFQDIYVDLPVFGNQKIVEADYVNTAGAYFKNILIAFVGFLTLIFTFKRWANIGSV